MTMRSCLHIAVLYFIAVFIRIEYTGSLRSSVLTNFAVVNASRNCYR